MKYNKTLNISLFIISVVSLITGCGKENKDVSKQVDAKNVVTEKTIKLNRDQLQLMDIELNPLEERVIYPTVYASGIVAPKPNLDAVVTPRISGTVDKVFVLEGSNVKKGQPLMSISSSELIQLQQDYMIALNDANFYQKEYDRQASLRSANVGALSEFQLVESKYLNAKSLEKTLKARLQLQGVNVDNLSDPQNAKIKTEKIITSPITGFIHNMPARMGMRAEQNTLLAEIIDLSELRADLYCYEKDINIITEGQEVDIEFVNKSIPSVKGKIENFDRTKDFETKAIVAHASFRTPKGHTVLPEMSITAKIKGLSNGRKIKAVRQSSIFDDGGNQSYIYYTTPSDSVKVLIFKRAKVRSGASDGDYVEINFEEAVPSKILIANNNVANLENEFKKQNSAE